MNPEKITPTQIAKMADDIRTVKAFYQDEAINHGFDATLLNVNVNPIVRQKKYDWPLLSFAGFLIIFFTTIVVHKLNKFTSEIDDCLLVFDLLFGTLATSSAQLKFKNQIFTWIIAIGLTIAVVIGFNILTPKEAISEAISKAK